MEQYTTHTLLPQRQTHMGGSGEALDTPATVGEPTHAELLAAIHGSIVSLEGEIKMVAVEVNLWRADIRKLSDKVKWYGVGSGRTSGVDGTDWRRRGDGLSQVSAQRCDDSVSRIEIQQDDTMEAVDPEQAVELAGPADVEAGVVSVDS
ncbi:hypothetical protein NDU88_003363 [Pleurodeles waltl]|uniref:Uncharacterized protein n=1 Tax=Pleurodeles waltl TaxID=8319 RepID=A0AAV7NGF8_PLEWA|nr:hypothetical protein NDU88_003363 [Pleurodeles waltl]